MDIHHSENPKPPSGFLCKSMFEYAHVQANGDVYPCCPSKFGKIIGNLTRQNLNEVWCSDAAREARESVLDGSYRYCNMDACEYLRNANAQKVPLSPPSLVKWVKQKGMIEFGETPKIINFAFDLSCNLSCMSCRRSLFRLTPSARERILTIDKNIFRSLSENTERIVLLGEGDPFASLIYREKLRNYNWENHPNLKIKIQTNGLLLTPELWNDIRISHRSIDWINISIDAATASTYKRIRHGNFDLLLRNLDYIANLRALHQIRRFCISFLVQASNYQEMPDFVHLGKSLGCDLIEFQRLENWATFSEKEFKERAVHEPDHPQYDDFLKVMSNSLMYGDKVWTLKLGALKEDLALSSVQSWDD